MLFFSTITVEWNKQDILFSYFFEELITTLLEAEVLTLLKCVANSLLPFIELTLLYEMASSSLKTSLHDHIHAMKSCVAVGLFIHIQPCLNLYLLISLFYIRSFDSWEFILWKFLLISKCF